MSLLFYSGCGEHLTAAQKASTRKWLYCNDCSVASGGYISGNCLDAGITSYSRPRCLAKVSPSPANRLTIGWRWFYPGSFPIDLPGLGFLPFAVMAAFHYSSSDAYTSSSTKQLSINMTGDGTIYVTRGDIFGVTLGTSAAGVLTGNAWNFLEADVVIDSTNGSFVIRRENSVVLVVSGVNTQALGVSAISGFEVMPWRIDDVYALDPSPDPSGDPRLQTFLGKGFHVLPLRPVANDTVGFSSPSTNYAEVDDATPDGSKNSTSFAGTTDLFQLETLTATRVIAVQPNIIANRASVSAAGAVAPVVKIDGLPYTGPAVTPDAAATDARSIWTAAPSDGSAWTADTINASRWGYQRAS